MSNIFSTKPQLVKISKMLKGYLMLPFSTDSIPGSLMEQAVGYVHKGKVLNTYDFVDVINKKKKVGWQVKSTKAGTPVTWKRAKIPNSTVLIAASKKNKQGLQNLGNAVIKFCNDHAAKSMLVYDLDEIGFSRLIVHSDGKLTYFERVLCTKQTPKIFNEDDFEWKWSTPKSVKEKEQLQALHGTHKASGKKWFAWHGLGENQLHFSGEKIWWPSSDEHKIDFHFPKNRISQEQLMSLLSKISTAT